MRGGGRGGGLKIFQVELNPPSEPSPPNYHPCRPPKVCSCQNNSFTKNRPFKIEIFQKKENFKKCPLEIGLISQPSFFLFEL